MNDSRPLIEMKNIDLIFGTFQALKNVSVNFNTGELVGLVGDNGAGKTTLIRILCGMHAPTNGEVYFDGQKINRFNPRLAIDLGIETIQQAVGLCNNLSIARNFYLGREPVKRRFGLPFLDFEKMRKKSESVIREFGLRENVSPDDEVEILSGGERQSIKIGHAVAFKNRVIIMDEPTNHLSVREREHVNRLAVQLKEQGLLVIYITHAINQVHGISDRIVILENGEKITDIKSRDCTAEELINIIRHGGRVVGLAENRE
jgi:simple sugar transport system ATP-binding protein